MLTRSRGTAIDVAVPLRPLPPVPTRRISTLSFPSVVVRIGIYVDPTMEHRIMSLRDQSLYEIVGADPSAPALPPESEALIRRTASPALRLIQRAPESAVVRAAAAGSNIQLIHALEDLLALQVEADDIQRLQS